MKKDKLRLTLMITILIIFIVTLGFWFFKDWQNGKDIGSLALLTSLFIIIVFVVLMIFIMSKGIKRGLPMEDEMSKMAKLKAGYFSYLISIYYLLALGWFGDDYFERPSQATGVGILGMAIIFLVLWVYFNKKGVK